MIDLSYRYALLESLADRRAYLELVAEACAAPKFRGHYTSPKFRGNSGDTILNFSYAHEVSNGTAKGTTRFVHDGDHIALEYNTAGTVLRRYVWGPEAALRQAQGDRVPILWDEGSAMNCTGTRFLLRDRLGSVVAGADCSGARVLANRYDGSEAERAQRGQYGLPQRTNPVDGQNANVGRFQYTGQAWIPDLGMYYYKARMYSPTLGRFMQTDPIGYEDGVNWYAYVGNDPVNGVDPTGESGECIDNGDGTRTCTITVTAGTVGSLAGVVLLQTAATAWNGLYAGYRGVKDFIFNNDSSKKSGKTAGQAADEEWEKIAEGSRIGPDGQREKDGGRDQAEEDFDKAEGVEWGGRRENGTRVKILPDGSRIQVRPSSDGRWTVERVPQSGRKGRANTPNRIRYNN